MLTINRLIQILCLFVLAATFAPTSARAVALLSEELELYLPWIEYQGQIYSTLLKPDNSNRLIFQVEAIEGLENNAHPNGLVVVGNDNNISIPLVSYRGELYSVTLNHNGSGSFQITSATNILALEGRGTVTSVVLMETKTVDRIAAEYPIATLAGLNLRYDVAVYRIGYQTQDAFGSLRSCLAKNTLFIIE